MPLYPQLPPEFETRIRAILVAAEGLGGRYLDDPSCPWSASFKQLIRPLLVRERQDALAAGSDGVENQFAGLDEGDRMDLLLKEVEETITSMKSLEIEMRGEADSGDRVQIIKAKTVLLEKWVSLKERVYTLKEMSDFQRTLLQVMDEVLDVDQRSTVMTKLNDLKSVATLRATVNTTAKG